MCDTMVYLLQLCSLKFNSVLFFSSNFQPIMERFTSCIAEKILELDSSKESDKVFRDGILRLLKEDSSYRRYLTNLIMGKFVKDETCYYWKVPDLENEFKPLSNSQLKKKLQSCNVQSLFELDLYNLAIVKKKFQEWRAHYDVMGPYFALRKLGISAKHASDITYLHYLKVLSRIDQSVKTVKK